MANETVQSKKYDLLFKKIFHVFYIILVVGLLLSYRPIYAGIKEYIDFDYKKNNQEVSGYVTDSVRGYLHIYKITYKYSLNNNDYSGISYDEYNYNINEKVTVEYLKEEPSRSRLIGARTSDVSPAELFGILLILACSLIMPVIMIIIMVKKKNIEDKEKNKTESKIKVIDTVENKDIIKDTDLIIPTLSFPPREVTLPVKLGVWSSRIYFVFIIFMFASLLFFYGNFSKYIGFKEIFYLRSDMASAEGIITNCKDVRDGKNQLSYYEISYKFKASDNQDYINISYDRNEINPDDRVTVLYVRNNPSVSHIKGDNRRKLIKMVLTDSSGFVFVTFFILIMAIVFTFVTKVPEFIFLLKNGEIGNGFLKTKYCQNNTYNYSFTLTTKEGKIFDDIIVPVLIKGSTELEVGKNYLLLYDPSNPSRALRFDEISLSIDETGNFSVSISQLRFPAIVLINFFCILFLSIWAYYLHY